jgi:hypothetical protein
MNMIRAFLIFIIGLGCFASCYYDSEEALYPNLDNSCDTSAVTYSGSIAPMINDNCIGCHGSGSFSTSGGNIRIDGYADVSSQADRILGAIKHNPAFSPMPKGAGKLTDCQITMFEIWIRDGKPNN